MQRNYFPTLNEALDAEGLLSAWDCINPPMQYGETRTWTWDDGSKYGRLISVYRDERGHYERPVHYARQSLADGRHAAAVHQTLISIGEQQWTSNQPISQRAKAAATDNGAPYAVFNLNPRGARLLVVRPAGNITGTDVVAAGPFNPDNR